MAERPDVTESKRKERPPDLADVVLGFGILVCLAFVCATAGVLYYKLLRWAVHL